MIHVHYLTCLQVSVLWNLKLILNYPDMETLLTCKVSKTETNATKIYTVFPLFQFRITQDTANSLCDTYCPQEKLN